MILPNSTRMKVFSVLARSGQNCLTFFTKEKQKCLTFYEQKTHKKAWHNDVVNQRAPPVNLKATYSTIHIFSSLYMAIANYKKPNLVPCFKNYLKQVCYQESGNLYPFNDQQEPQDPSWLYQQPPWDVPSSNAKPKLACCWAICTAQTTLRGCLVQDQTWNGLEWELAWQYPWRHLVRH